MTIYLGLGANQGDRRRTLSQGIETLGRHDLNILGISPVFETPALLPPDAPDNWNIPYLNCVVAVDTVLSPQQGLALIRQVENALGRDRSAGRWSPRTIDIDILLWNDIALAGNADLTIPHPEMQNRAFVLDPLSHLAPQLSLPGYDRSVLNLARSQRQHQPLIMGVLNLTEDSFSDGGIYTDPAKLTSAITAWVKSGVHILDIGAESTRPGASILTPEQEWERIIPCLDLLSDIKKTDLPPLLSLDSYHPETAAKAITWGFDIINDVSGLSSAAMRNLIRDNGVTAIAMHSLTVPADKSVTLPAGCDPVAALKEWLSERIDLWLSEGMDLGKIIFDPGIGFNKTPHQSIELLRRIDEFADFPVRTLIGHSRKSFMNIFSQQSFSNRDPETLGLSIALMGKGVDILRVHNPLEHQRAIQAFLHIT